MLKISFKIWCIANVVVFSVFVISLFPGGFSIGFLALVFSCIFSLPAIACLYFLLWVLRYMHGNILFSWIVLLSGTAVTAFVSYYLFSLWSTETSGELNFILPLSLVSGFSAVLFLSPSLHYLLQKFQYESENDND